MIMSDLAKF